MNTFGERNLTSPGTVDAYILNSAVCSLVLPGRDNWRHRAKYFRYKLKKFYNFETDKPSDK